MADKNSGSRGAFELPQDEEDPGRFVVFEVYTDAAALAYHHTTPHFLAFQCGAGTSSWRSPAGG